VVKTKDLVGQKFGRLTVVERAADHILPNGKKLAKWVCSCDCEAVNPNRIIVLGGNLRSGTTKSCGCLQKETASKTFFNDLTGKVFGRWTVLRLDEKKTKEKDGKYKDFYWVCQCSCVKKTIKTINGCSLKNGHSKSCGCLHNEMLREANFQDLTGQIFNRLTVIQQTEDYINSTGKTYTQWLCQCSCNPENPKFNIIRACHLKSGKTQSCGCYGRERTSEANKRYNEYDLTGSYGVGYTLEEEPFFFDLEDYDKIKGYCWGYDKDDYVCTKPKGKNLFFHRLVMNPKRIDTVDHIYRIHHDNRKSELRIVTNSQNGMNRIIASNNTSGFKGVCWDKRGQRWLSRIGLDNKTIVKAFKDKEDAIAYRKLLEEEYFGEYNIKTNND
jgi:hypothetical protein